MEEICKNCEYAIFCPSWGEYKCILYGKKIFFPDIARTCFVKAKDDVLSKTCHCEVCLEKGCIEDDEE